MEEDVPVLLIVPLALVVLDVDIVILEELVEFAAEHIVKKVFILLQEKNAKQHILILLISIRPQKRKK